MKPILPLLIILLGLSIINAGEINSNNPPTSMITVCTFNIRYANASDAEAGHGWEQRRKEQIRQWLAAQTLDVIGFQEVLPLQNEDLQTMLEAFDHYGLPRDDGHSSGEMSPIYWRKDRFEKIAARTLWLSETPGQPGPGWDAGLSRIVTHVTLREKASGRILEIWNTHFDNRGSEARLESAKLISTWSSDAAQKNTDQILMGDFNCLENSPPVMVLKKANWGLVGDNDNAKVEGPIGTIAPGFTHVEGTPRIDHVFCRGSLLPITRTTHVSKANGLVHSDHLPVVVEFEFSNTD